MKFIQLIVLFALFSCSDRTQQLNNRALNSKVLSETQDWKSELTKTLKLFGHRNLSYSRMILKLPQKRHSVYNLI